MASKFRGAATSSQAEFRKDTPQSARMNALRDLMNVGPLEENILADIHNEMGTLYQGVVDENVQQINPTVGGGIDPSRSVSNTYDRKGIGYTGPGEVETRVAGNVGRSQELYNEQFMQGVAPGHPGLDPEQDIPYLSPEQEIYYLKEFARLKGVTTLEVESSPALREEFGRYLGQKTMTIDYNRYYGYTPEGETYRGPNGGKVPTAYRMPTQIGKYNREAYPDSTSTPQLLTSEMARGDREKIVQNLVDYGMLREHAEERYDAALLMDPEKGVIADNMSAVAAASTSDSAKASYKYFEDGMAGMSAKVHKSLQRTMRQGAMGPRAIERFAMKFEKGNPNFTRTQAREFLYSFIAAYAVVAEANPNAGLAFSDYMLLSVFNHARTKIHSHERKKQDSESEATRSETTEEAQKRGERNLLVGINDERKIGLPILTELGFPNATTEQQAIAGALARSIVVDAFQDVDANPQSEGFGNWNRKLFEKEQIAETNPDGSLVLDEYGKEKLHDSFTLTGEGLEIAERLVPLFNTVMPSARKKVRKQRRPVKQGVGPRKTQNTKDIFGNKVDHGDTAEMDDMKNVAENTGVGINPLMTKIMGEIAQEAETIQTGHGSNLDSPKYIAAYQQTMMYDIQHAKYQNMKGDGTGEKGTYHNRPGKVLKRDRQGNFLKKNEATGIDEIVEQDFADALDDYSDRIKDAEFDHAIQFLKDNLGTEFFYDYFFGLNTRLNVDQTDGNYQHSKMIRSVIQSYKPFDYQLNNSIHVISLKAGIMKRFGYDKMDVLTAADQFDKEVGAWATTTTKEKIAIGKEWEGWATVASIAEAVEFYKYLQDPSAVSYPTGFYTEIDGLTNGMAHSAVQSGDMRTGWGAGVFDPIRYDHWVRNYDMIEKHQREGNLQALIDLEKEKGNSIQFEVFLDAYNRVNENMKDNIRRLWGSSKKGLSGVPPTNVGLPGLLSQGASDAMVAIMELAHAGGDGKGQGSKRFMDAIRIMTKVDETGKPRNKLGRAFVKKPVMIFGYGAGAARIGEAVRMFVDDLFMQDPSLRQEFIDNGIDIDKEFIDPLGVIAAEAVTQSFGIIKEFATTLSQAAKVASDQRFALNIPTLAGYKINLGGKTYKIDLGPGQTVKYQYYPGDFASEKLLAEEGKRMATSRSHLMKAEFDPFFEIGGYLKAATQITVMMNHANDNINMNRHLVNVHRRKLANRKTPIEYNSTVTERGNTALHIFDGLLVMPFEAEMHADELNLVFKQMATGQKKSGLDNRGHTSFVIDALTYEMRANGDRIVDPLAGNIGTRTKLLDFDLNHKRLLNEEGKALAAIGDNSGPWGTWHPLLDKYAFQWTEKAAEVLAKLNMFDKRRQTMANQVSNYHQFFWATQKVDKIIQNNPERVKAHMKARRKIAA